LLCGAFAVTLLLSHLAVVVVAVALAAPHAWFYSLLSYREHSLAAQQHGAMGFELLFGGGFKETCDVDRD